MRFFEQVIFLPFAIVLIGCALMAVFSIFYAIYEIVQTRRFSFSLYEDGAMLLRKHIPIPTLDAAGLVIRLSNTQGFAHRIIAEDMILLRQDFRLRAFVSSLLIKASISYLGPTGLVVIRNHRGPSILFWALFVAALSLCATFAADNAAMGVPVFACCCAFGFLVRYIRHTLEKRAAEDFFERLIRVLT